MRKLNFLAIPLFVALFISCQQEEPEIRVQVEFNPELNSGKQDNGNERLEDDPVENGDIILHDISHYLIRLNGNLHEIKTTRIELIGNKHYIVDKYDVFDTDGNLIYTMHDDTKEVSFVAEMPDDSGFGTKHQRIKIPVQQTSLESGNVYFAGDIDEITVPFTATLDGKVVSCDVVISSINNSIKEHVLSNVKNSITIPMPKESGAYSAAKLWVKHINTAGQTIAGKEITIIHEDAIRLKEITATLERY